MNTLRMASEARGTERKRSSIVTRITLVLVVLVVISATLSGWLVYRGSADQALINARRDMGHTLQLAELRLRSFSATMAADIDFLAENDPLNDLAALADTLDSTATSITLERTALLFNSFIRTRSEYAQARFIAADSLGRERVRFDRIAGEVVRTPDTLLQAKGDRDYFQATIGLPQGARYHSRIDLNKEHGAIVRPFMPTMRSAAPVYSPRGTLAGIVIINADLRPLFAELLGLAPADCQLMLADTNDELILHPDTARTFRFEFGSSMRMPVPLDGDVGVEDPGIWPVQLMQAHAVDIESTGQRYVLGIQRDTSALLEGLRQVRDRQILTVGGVAFACIVIGLFFARSIAGRLDRLTNRVEAYASGAVNEPLPVERADEIGRLARSVQHMQQRIDERMRELEHARDRAERAERTQQDFLANMSHELRTPLNAIIGMSGDVETNALSAADQEKLAIVGRSAQRVRGLVDDLLDHSRIVDGRLVLKAEPYSPRQLLQDLLAAHLAPARAKGLALIADIKELPVTCLGDALRIHQVVDNLLGNAVKFTRNGQVKLSACTIAGEVPRLEIVVADSGPGIPPNEQARVFARFERAASVDSKAEPGEGLGLAITQALVKAMQGSIQLSSAVGEGATFTLQLPAPVALLTPLPPTPVVAETKGLNVLYVEDVETNRMLLRNWAQPWGWRLHCATTSQEAIALCTAQGFDIMLIDLDLGDDMHGTELSLRLRGLAKHRFVPMIAVTAFIDDMQAAKVWQSGMNDRITKPIDKDELQRKVAYWATNSPDVETPDLENVARQYDADGEKLIALLQQFRKELAKHRAALMHAVRVGDMEVLNRVRHQLRPQFELMRMAKGLVALGLVGTEPVDTWMPDLEVCFTACDRAMLALQRKLQALGTSTKP
ncbi:MAG: response regulator [Flavobacteriales bacterium]|nr:response regulator [Flavobacteriales bacterium]